MPDKPLACAPVRSGEGQRYLAAMAAAANFAWANRQYIAYWVRRSLEHVFHRNVEDIGMSLVYDVAHNIAKIERHRFEGAEVELCVHRKGATRAFSAGHPDVPERSAHARNTIAGSMPFIRRTGKNDATTAIASVMGDFVNGRWTTCQTSVVGQFAFRATAG